MDAKEQTQEIEQTPQSYDELAVKITQCMSTMDQDESTTIPLSQDEIAMALSANKAEKNLEKFPMNPTLIAREQLRDKELQKSIKTNPTAYTRRIMEGSTTICYKNRVVIPKSLQQWIVAWYHQYLAHLGATRMEASLRQDFTWVGLSKDVLKFVKLVNTVNYARSLVRITAYCQPKKLSQQFPRTG